MMRRESRSHSVHEGRRLVVATLVAGLAAALAVVAGCESGTTATTSKVDTPVAPQAEVPASRPRVVVIGLDAGTWNLLGPWMDQGLLPNLARLRENGVHGKLRSTQPSSSPVIWTSIATGKTPDKTGISWFVRFPNGPGKPVPVDRRQRRTKAIWNMLGENRIDVAVLGWYVTWPAEEVYGRLQSDLAHFGRMDGGAWPAGFLWDQKPVEVSEAVAAMPRFMDFPYDPAKAAKKEGEVPSLDFLVYDRFLRAWARDRFYLDAARRTLTDGPLPEAFFLYLRGTDDVQHGFWKFMDPAAFTPRNGPDGKPLGGTTVVPPEQVAAFGKVIERYWQWTDEEVGKLLAHYTRDGGTPPLVIICSDHGAGPAIGEQQVEVPEYLHLSGAHLIDGIFLASGPGIRRGSAGGKGIEIEGATIYDIAPTILHALGLPIAKDLDGKVLTSIFDKDLAEKPDTIIETWDSGSAPADEPAAEEEEAPTAVDEKVLEHLQSLGYIGK